MQTNIDTTRRRIGEMVAMSRQTQEAERKILARAQELLKGVYDKIPSAKASSLLGDGDEYMSLIAERGRLQQVIAQARTVLGGS